MANKKKFIQDAINPAHKGALRKKMGVKEGKTIPMDKLKSEAKNAKNPTTRKQASLAITLKKMKKK
jgi:hypothetical protein